MTGCPNVVVVVDDVVVTGVVGVAAVVERMLQVR